MKRLSIYLFGIIASSIAVSSCGELTGPKSPETPVNVTATLITATSVEVRWQPSPQSDGVVSYNILRNGQKVAESGTTSYTDTGLSELTTYKYTISANCKGGVLSDPSAESPAATVTTRDATPPRVTNISPFQGQTGVSISATVTVTFNEPMDPSTINTNTFSLKVASTQANIPGTVTYNTTSRIATFTPSSALPSSSDITATITTGMKDLAGNALSLTTGSPGVWTFTTADFDPPRVTATSPANGATGVASNTTVTVTFSEAMDASTMNATNITLKVTSSGAAVPGTVTYNATSHVATFTPNAALTSATTYTISVAGAVKDLAGNQMGTPFQASFTILDTTPPTVVSTSPANLATNVPTTTTVSATFSKPMNPATLNPGTFFLRNAATGIAVAVAQITYDAATNTATLTPAAPLASFTTYNAQITTGAKDTFDNPVAANFNWTFSTADVVPPVVSAVSPTNGQANVATNSAVNITFSKGMDASTINGTNITLKATTTGVAVTGSVSYNAGTNVATFTPTAALANNTGYTVTVTTGVKDAAGNALASQFTSTFTTVPAPDTTAPTVLSTSPADGANNVSQGTTITATFSEAMDPATISTTTFTVKTTTGSNPVAGTVTYNAATNTATFTPTAQLSASTNYTATVTTGAKDVAGNALAANKVWAFTTAADVTAPTVTATSPTNGAINVSVGTTVTVTFSEAMDPTTINTTTLSLKVTSTSAPVTGTVAYNATTHVATFTPSAPLTANTDYTATVSTGAKDAAGNALAGTFIFTFKTAP